MKKIVTKSKLPHWLTWALILAMLFCEAGSQIKCQDRSGVSPILKVRDETESLLSPEMDPVEEMINKHMPAEEGYSLLPDSVVESVNLGYKEYYTKWFYHYDAYYRLDTLYKNYFDSNWNRDDITVFETYNTAGKLITLLRRQRDPWAMMVYGDSSMVDYYREDYTWENGRLVKEEVSEYEYEYTSTTYYVYDESGTLILDSTSWGGINQYVYSENGDLRYTRFSTDNYQSITKYTYERTDTSCFTTVQLVYYYFDDPEVTFDTISRWNYSQYYEEYFDEAGRKISIMRTYNNGYEEVIDYRADYQYTAWGAVEGAWYYDWVSTEDGGKWMESTRITLQYNEEQKIAHYENWFWDARLEDWVPEIIRDYFYSPVSNELGIENSARQSLFIYPNPAREVIHLKAEQEIHGHYRIFDIRGNTIMQGRLTQNQIRVAGLSPGLYILEFSSNTSKLSARFIKF